MIKTERLSTLRRSGQRVQERIVDYSAGKPGGLDHFYSQLNLLVQKQQVGRPVRIAYYGDSYIEGDILLADLRERPFKKYIAGWVMVLDG